MRHKRTRATILRTMKKLTHEEFSRKGGKVKCKKGFACPHVQAKAQKARRAKK